MPEGPAARGVEANASAGPCGALVVRRAFDGAEHSGNIEPVMAGPHTARHGFRRDRPSNHGRTAGRLSVHVDTARAPATLVGADGFSELADQEPRGTLGQAGGRFSSHRGRDLDLDEERLENREVPDL
jgi:hypothetical protein